MVLDDCLLAGALSPPPGLRGWSHTIEASRLRQRVRIASILSSSRRFVLSETTSNDKFGFRRKLADLLCQTVMQSPLVARCTRGADGGGFEAPVRFGTHGCQA